jgi:hypothetical protein
MIFSAAKSILSGEMVVFGLSEALFDLYLLPFSYSKWHDLVLSVQR